MRQKCEWCGVGPDAVWDSLSRVGSFYLNCGEDDDQGAVWVETDLNERFCPECTVEAAE